MGKLTDKQLRFVDEYCIDMNATQAAIRAGYSEKSAYSIGQQNLRKLEIVEVLEQRKKQAREQLQEQFALDAVVARKVMRSILTNNESSDKDRIVVARDFLDRAGFKSMDKVEHSGEINNPFAELTAEELKKLVDNVKYDDS